MDLETLILQAQKDQNKSPSKVAKKVESIFNSHPLVGGALTGLASLVLNFIPYQAGNLRDAIIVGVGFGGVNSFLNIELAKDEQNWPLLPTQKTLQSLLHHPVIPTAIVLTAERLSEPIKFQHMISNVDIDTMLHLGRLFLVRYLITSAVIKVARYAIATHGKSYFFGFIGGDTQKRARGWFNPLHDLEKLKSASKLLQTSLDLKFNVPFAISLYYNNLLQGNVEGALTTLNLFGDNLVREQGVQEFGGIGTKFITKYYLDRLKETTANPQILSYGNLFGQIVNQSDLEKLLLQISQDQPSSALPQIILANYYRTIDQLEKSREHFLKAIAMFPFKPTASRISALSGSRRKTGIIDLPLTKHAYIFQIAKPDEVAMAIATRKIFGSAVTEVLEYFPEEEIAIHRREICKYARDLYHALPLMSKGEILWALLKTMDFIPRFQQAQSLFEREGIIFVDELTNDPNYYGNRMNDLFLSRIDYLMLPPVHVADMAELIQDISDIYSAGEIEALQNKVPYWDANWLNILFGRKRRVIFTDFQNRQLKIPGIDVISAAEFCDCLNDKEKAYIYAQYLRNTPGLTTSDFLIQLHFGGVQRHLEFFGYRGRDVKELQKLDEYFALSNLGAQVYHLNMAQRHSLAISRMQITSVDFSRFADNLAKVTNQFNQVNHDALLLFTQAHQDHISQVRKQYSFQREMLKDPEVWKSMATFAVYSTIYAGVGTGIYLLLDKLFR